MATEEEKTPEETTAQTEAEAQENQPEDNAAENSEAEDQAETTAQGKSVRPYDFRRPQHLSGDQMRSLQRLHKSAADYLQETLSRAYGTSVQIQLESVEELAFGLMREAVAQFTYSTVLDLQPLNIRGVLYVESQICLAFVDRVLGGFSASPPEPRALTAIDEVAIESVISLTLTCLEKQWQDFCEIKFKAVESRTDPELVQPWTASDAVLAVTFAVAGSMGEGKIRLCLPVARLKAAVDGVAIRSAALQASPERAAAIKHALMHSVERASLSIVASFDDVEVPIRNLSNLREGDVIRLDHPVDDPIMMNVGSRPTFLAKMGLRGRRKAVQLVTRVTEYEE